MFIKSRRDEVTFLFPFNFCMHNPLYREPKSAVTAGEQLHAPRSSRAASLPGHHAVAKSTCCSINNLHDFDQLRIGCLWSWMIPLIPHFLWNQATMNIWHWAIGNTGSIGHESNFLWTKLWVSYHHCTIRKLRFRPSLRSSTACNRGLKKLLFAISNWWLKLITVH